MRKVRTRLEGFTGYTEEEIVAKLSKSFEFSVNGWGTTTEIRVKRNDHSVKLRFYAVYAIVESRNTREATIDLTGHVDDWKRIRATVNRRLKKEETVYSKRVAQRNEWRKESEDLRTLLGNHISIDRITINSYGEIVIDEKLTIKKWQCRDSKTIKFQGFRVSFEKLSTFVESIV